MITNIQQNKNYYAVNLEPLEVVHGRSYKTTFMDDSFAVQKVTA